MDLRSFLDQANTAPEVLAVGDVEIDTTEGVVRDDSGILALPTAVLEGAERPVGVFVVQVNSLAAGNIRVTGHRALAVVSTGPIVLSGILSVDASFDEHGPGGIAGCRAGSGAGSGGAWGGGGGGSFGSPGGRGGRGNAFGGGRPGEVAGTAELVPLRGGCPGGHSGGGELDSDPNAADPGGAGGAVQLVSRVEILLEDGGFVSAGGGGGKGWTGRPIACLINTRCFPGEGAGSGGGILLEAPVVRVTSGAGLAANGGGGSCGGNFGSGANGTRSNMPALGNVCSSTAYGNGGNGASATASAANGGGVAASNGHGGGGGGGFGRIRVNLPAGASFSPEGTVSPSATVGALRVR